MSEQHRTDPADYFSPSYAQARRKFLAAAESAGLTTVSHLHPLPGREAEALAMDVVVDGDPAGEDLLIVSSGCHGVEGYGGSGVQVFALRNQALRKDARAHGVTLVHIHALNPYGFSHLRRSTHENVDLNRNFHDFSQPLPANEAYRDIHHVLVPDQWPPTAQNQAAMLEIASTMGLKAFQAVVARGQHEFADGLFFGGSEPCWSNLTLRKVLREIAAGAKRIAWIDLHTGLGPVGVGERILACRSESPAHARARAWWGTNVTSIHDDTSVSGFVTGPMWTAAPEECPRAEYTGIAIEYGTVPVLEVLHALRADNWLHLHRNAPAGLAGQIRGQMMGTFYVDTDEWKVKVVDQACEAMTQAIAGLAASR
jgi:hypothetical protein